MGEIQQADGGIGRWRGRVAVVTGASSGIGAAIARRLAREGLRVALLARRLDRLSVLESELRDAGGTVQAWRCDVTREDDVVRTFAEVSAYWNAPDVLVNNAGTGSMGSLASGRWQEWQDTLTTNVAAPVLCVREALRAMEGKAEAQIVNVGSIYGHRGQVPDWAFYQGSKFALRAMTDTLRAELHAAGRRVRVAMISPGMVATEFRERASGGAFRYESYFEKLHPLLPEDIAEAVCYVIGAPPHVQVHDIQLSPMGQGL
jgi:NADP-dependent 3-hydroxy acid dehydrogenase YdfG